MNNKLSVEKVYRNLDLNELVQNLKIYNLNSLIEFNFFF